MFLNFLELKFKNFLSFGSQMTTINFENGLNLITGKNGGGKSGSLLDPLSFCIYGKPYRKIKIRELINRTNKKKLYTECSFKIDNDNFKIIRTQLPDSIEFFKNNTQIDLESSKKLIQDEINRIVGIDYNMFKQVIALAINYNKPFLEMDCNEKREVIESITNIKILGEMLKLSKINVSNLKTQIDINTTAIKIFEENLYSTNKRIKELTNAKNNFDKNLKDDMTKIENKLILQNEELIQNKNQLSTFESLKENIIEFESSIKKLKIDLNKINKTINVEKYKEESAEKNVKFLNSNEICPSCNQNLSKEHKENEKEKLKNIIQSCINNIKINEIEHKKIENNISSLTEKIKEQNELKFKIDNLNQKIKWLEEEIKNNTEIKNEISNRKINFNIESLQKEFDKKTEEYLRMDNDNESKKIEQNNYEIVNSIISDNGIKAYFFKKIMPILNSKINENLKKFDIKIKIEITEFLEDKIYGLDLQGQEISYFSHSEGEKKRIDISILLAFIEITKLICNWDCSLLIFDEILDAKVDEDGLEIMISALKNLIHKNKKLCAYVISHRMQESDAFDRHFRISKPTGFSKIEKIY